MNRVVVTRGVIGICHMQVCAVSDVEDDEILTVCNRENPSGTTCGWYRVIRKDNEYAQGPVVCSDDETRKHFIVSC